MEFSFIESWWRSLRRSLTGLIPLLEKVLEFLMDHLKVLVSQAERLPISKAFNRRHLVKKNQVVVLDVEVNGVKVLSQDLGVNDVDASLFEAHVHDTTKNLEQILENILLCMLVKVLDFTPQWQDELVLLDSHALS